MRLGSVDIVGGGPAGLYAAILVRRWLPGIRLRVFEQNPIGATFGFGVVFSDRALDFLKDDDEAIHDLITPRMERWRNMVLNHPDGSVTLDGIGFSAIGRLELIEILRTEAEKLDVDMHFSHPLRSPGQLDADLIVGADGINSMVRRSDESGFEPALEYFENHFAWFGTARSFDTLTQTFVNTERGPFNAHHYRFDKYRSTFIVECEEPTFRAWQFEEMDETESASICSEIFADVLEGKPLETNKSSWRRFPRLWCRRWHSGNRVLLGDAAHTAHFSIGSGTRLALEDGIALVRALSAHDDLQDALLDYETQRKPIARKLFDAANTSAIWYETFGIKMQLRPMDFAYDYITRSGRIDMHRLHQIAPGFASRYEEYKRVESSVNW